MSIVRVPRSRRPAAGWGTRAVLAIAILAQLFACQALLAPTGPAPVAAVIQDLGHGIGHDTVCEAGATPVIAGAARALVPDCLPPADPALVLVALIAAGLVAARATAGGTAPWAPRRLLPGRRRLLAVGIARV